MPRQPTHIFRRHHFWQVLVVVLAAPYVLAVLGTVEKGKAAVRRVPGGVHAWEGASPVDGALSRRSSHATLAAVVEALKTGASHPRQAFLGASGSSSAAAKDAQHVSASTSAPSHVLASEASTGNDNETATAHRSEDATRGTASAQTKGGSTLSRERWGQSAVYVPDANIVLFSGGQIAASDGSSPVTNDVFALDLNGDGTATSKRSHHENSTQWIQLSSKDAPLHAYSARAITRTSKYHGQNVFLVGGSTDNCSASTAPIYMWDNGNTSQWRDGAWVAPAVGATAKMPPRRRGATAVQVPSHLGMASENISASKHVEPSFMVMGGEQDATTCSQDDSEDVSVYTSVDIWTVKNSTSLSAKRAEGSPSAYMEVRSLPLDMRMPNLSLVDYSAVVLPANETAKQNTRILFLGGRNSNGSLTPMTDLWALDVDTSSWLRINAIGMSRSSHDIPSGRIGHSSTLLDDGLILVHGGYTSLANARNASASTYTLDVRSDPAVWQRIAQNAALNKRGKMDEMVAGRAYHSAVLANGVLIIAFGQQSTGFNASISRAYSTQKGASGAASQLQFLDTTSSGFWTWSDSYASILADRRQSIAAPATQSQQISSAAPTSSTQPEQQNSSETPQTPSSQEPDDSTLSGGRATESKPSQTVVSDPSSPSQTKEAETDHQTPVAATSAFHKPSITFPTASSNGDTGDNSNDSYAAKQKKVAVLASVLGAAAAVGAVGAAFAAYRRFQSRRGDSDAASADGDKYERFIDGSSGAHGAPLVSSLWINQPMAWAANAGRGPKRQASNASLSDEQHNISRRHRGARDTGTPNVSPWRSTSSLAASYTVPPKGERSFHVIRDAPRGGRLGARQNEKEEQARRRRRLREQGRENYGGEYHDDQFVDVFGGGGKPGRTNADTSDPFVTSHDDEMQPNSTFQQILRRGTQRDDDDGSTFEGRNAVLPLTRAASNAGMSTFSGEGASHFSYPYLSAVRRSSQANTRSALEHGEQTPSTVLASPMSCADWPSTARGKNARLAERAGHNVDEEELAIIAAGNPFGNFPESSIVYPADNLRAMREQTPTELDFGSTVAGSPMVPWQPQPKSGSGGPRSPRDIVGNTATTPAAARGTSKAKRHQHLRMLAPVGTIGNDAGRETTGTRQPASQRRSRTAPFRVTNNASSATLDQA